MMASYTNSNKYHITLWVTVEEELAIMHMFYSKGWQYMKFNTREISDSINNSPLELDPADELQNYPTTSQNNSSVNLSNSPVVSAQKQSVFSKKAKTVVKKESATLSEQNTVTEGSSRLDETHTRSSAVVKVKSEAQMDVNTSETSAGIHEDHAVTSPCSNASTLSASTLSADEYDDEPVSLPSRRGIKVGAKSIKKNYLISVASKKLKAARRKTVTKRATKDHPVLTDVDRNLSEMSLLVVNQSQENQFTCCICDSTFCDVDQFKAHAADVCLKNLQGDDKPSFFKCKDCRGNYRNAFTLVRHRLSQVCQPGKTNKMGKFLKCEVCDKVYPQRRQTDFTLHVMLHNNNRPHQCPECGKQFIRWQSLRDHKRVHTGEKPFQCSYCPLAFVTKSHKRNHELYRHIDVPRSFVCEKCGAAFKFKGWLTTHVKEVHTDARNHCCNICNKQFKRKGSLNEHLKNHSTRDKICHICGKGFHRQAYLNTHARRHTDENRQHKCTECNKAFFTRQNLKQHIRVHSGEKPFACVACTYKCTTRGNLKKHMKALHPDIAV